jgi:hypothetical protein
MHLILRKYVVSKKQDTTGCPWKFKIKFKRILKIKLISLFFRISTNQSTIEHTHQP